MNKSIRKEDNATTPSPSLTLPTEGSVPFLPILWRSPASHVAGESSRLASLPSPQSEQLGFSESSSDEEELPETVYSDNWTSLIRQAEHPPTCWALDKLPSRIIPHPSISGATVRFIMSQYEPLFKLIIFKPAQFRMRMIKSRFIMKIISSNMTHWSMYLGAKIFQSLLRDGESANIRGYLPLLDRFDKLCITSGSNDTTEDLINRLSSGLELAFLRYLTANTATAHNFMQNLARIFLQLALEDPSLWSRNPMFGVVSLAHTLVSSRFELVRFVFMDAISSLLLGTPPMINFDTSHPAIIEKEPHPMEWVHGCPAELLVVAVKINMWRAQSLDRPASLDPHWRELEHEVWGWRSRGEYGLEKNSWRLVARLAVQEGWRHAILIYLYLGMCGVNSCDPRVQSSVQQISKLITVLQSDTAAGLHFWVPVMIAAICARGEAQRGIMRDSIIRVHDGKPWLMRGSEFAAILDRLWHGPAADARAVTWDDYINARKATISIGASPS